MKKKLLLGFVGIAAVLIIGYITIGSEWNLLVHHSLGYGRVYETRWKIGITVKYVAAFLVMILSVLAVRPLRVFGAKTLIYTVAGLLGWSVGFGLGSVDINSWLLMLHHVDFGKKDPIFHLDYAFYTYNLPIYSGFLGRIVAFTLYIAVLRGAIFAGVYKNEPEHYPHFINAFRYITFTGAFLFVVLAVENFLGRYRLLIDKQSGSFLFGPGFTDVHWTIPIFSLIHVIISLIVSFLFVMTGIRAKKIMTKNSYPNRYSMSILMNWKDFKLPAMGMGFYLFSFLITGLIAASINGIYVKPNEATVDAPYIQKTITATRWSLGIQNVKTTTFTPKTNLDAKEIAKGAPLLKNVRINDIGQTASIYNQLQSFKNYFNFSSAHADRYNGKEVYVSARQMDVKKLPVQTWVNTHLVYTHGYGVVASPVNSFDGDGLPTMIAKNTPQETSEPLPKVTQPQIYFSFMNNNAIAPSKEGEFDYPSGNGDVTSHYQGGYGINVDQHKLLLAFKNGTLKFLTSDQITPQSQWLFDRNIYNRVKAIAPFLNYDNDAFPFIGKNGHIMYMLDAYTESNNIPYAQQFDNTNYVRNSVKVVMDAYTGKVTFYVVEKNDPMLQSLMKIYPSLFTTNIPADVKAHFRYPKDLFAVQAQALTTYHMTNPQAFYNQEDKWSEAQQIYDQNKTQLRGPVYQMIQMPDKTQPQFVLSELFTPQSKQNLNGWLIADSSSSDYGKITLYQFPQSSLVFGPMQAENQIDSAPSISSQLTLWNQQGSHVVRGNLLMIPVGHTILYIEPVYLVADRSGSLPQLQRVIVDFNKKVYMGNSLGGALNNMLQNLTGSTPLSNVPPTKGEKTSSLSSLASQAQSDFTQYKKDTAAGNVAKAGEDLQNMQNALSQMIRQK